MYIHNESAAYHLQDLFKVIVIYSANFDVYERAMTTTLKELPNQQQL